MKKEIKLYSTLFILALSALMLSGCGAEKNMKKGDNVIFTAFGAGFVHGASFYKWAYDGDSLSTKK